jgi:hypothetical protein
MKTKYILKHISISVIVYAIIYLVRAFVIWDLTNPFQWIIDIPIYSEDTRLNIVGALIIYNYILYLISTRNE